MKALQERQEKARLANRKEMAPRILDFIVIGAQKAGTTALHRYLSPHPAIFLPSEKELPFFCGQRADDNVSWTSFFEEHYRRAAYGAVLGKVTPHYMMDKRVPWRIASVMPGIKLIAILRHPVERAFSHYRHLVRLGLENRSFNNAVLPLLNRNDVENIRNLPFGLEHQNLQYLVLGEYGRILEMYYGQFHRKQIMVIFSDELKRDRLRVVQDLFAFIGVDLEFVPATLGKEYNVGGERAIISRERISELKRHAIVKLVWNACPPWLKSKVRLFFIYHNTREDNNKDNRDPRQLLDRSAWTDLCDYFRADVLALEGLTGKEVPWNDFKNKR